MDSIPLYSFLNLASQWYLVVEGSLLFFLLFLSAMISGAEVAFFSLSKTTLDTLEKSNEPKNELVLRLLKQPKKIISNHSNNQ